MSKSLGIACGWFRLSPRSRCSEWFPKLLEAWTTVSYFPRLSWFSASHIFNGCFYVRVCVEHWESSFPFISAFPSSWEILEHAWCGRRAILTWSVVPWFVVGDTERYSGVNPIKVWVVDDEGFDCFFVCRRRGIIPSTVCRNLISLFFLNCSMGLFNVSNSDFIVCLIVNWVCISFIDYWLFL